MSIHSQLRSVTALRVAGGAGGVGLQQAWEQPGPAEGLPLETGRPRIKDISFEQQNAEATKERRAAEQCRAARTAENTLLNDVESIDSAVREHRP